ncbi:MAG: cupin domain-containing protein [Clostridia bacterium]|nr:cupin domain-containing protein [Clostridia bacterium]
MEFISKDSITSLHNPGVVSRQLLCPENAPGARATITEVHLAPGGCQPRHTHPASEQTWVALRGAGRLLLADGQEAPFSAGDVVRFAEGDVHGLVNNGGGELVYLSVTAPPLSFAGAYERAELP